MCFLGSYRRAIGVVVVLFLAAIAIGAQGTKFWGHYGLKRQERQNKKSKNEKGRPNLQFFAFLGVEKRPIHKFFCKRGAFLTLNVQKSPIFVMLVGLYS